MVNMVVIKQFISKEEGFLHWNQLFQIQSLTNLDMLNFAHVLENFFVNIVGE